MPERTIALGNLTITARQDAVLQWMLAQHNANRAAQDPPLAPQSEIVFIKQTMIEKPLRQGRTQLDALNVSRFQEKLVDEATTAVKIQEAATALGVTLAG